MTKLNKLQMDSIRATINHPVGVYEGSAVRQMLRDLLDHIAAVEAENLALKTSKAIRNMGWIGQRETKAQVQEVANYERRLVEADARNRKLHNSVHALSRELAEADNKRDELREALKNLSSVATQVSYQDECDCFECSAIRRANQLLKETK